VHLPCFQNNVFSTASLRKNNWQDPKELQLQVRREIIEAQEKIKLKFDLKRCLEVKYEVGKVVLMQSQSDPYLSSKLQRKYRDRPLQVWSLKYFHRINRRESQAYQKMVRISTISINFPFY